MVTVLLPPQPLTAGDIDLVRDSFVEVLLAPDRAAAIFYDRLFVLAPDTRPLFHGDLEEQGRALIAALARIATGLAQLEAMAPALAALAIRHVGYGAQPRHYAIVGEALLDMIDGVTAPDVRARTRAAWANAYARVATAMIAAAYPPAEIVAT